MKTPDSIHCRPGTTDAMQRLADENEALRAERDELAANAERLRLAIIYFSHDIDKDPKNTDGHYSKAQKDLFTVLLETPSQSLARIRAAGAKETLKRAMSDAGFSGTVVRVDMMREIIEQMEGE